MAATDIVSIKSLKAVLRDGSVVTISLNLSGDNFKIGEKTLTEALSDAKIRWEDETE